jgi:hypothetical protein
VRGVYLTLAQALYITPVTQGALFPAERRLAETDPLETLTSRD